MKILEKAIQSTHKSQLAFSKFITANDAGTTGGHQSGFHIHKNAWSLIFESPGEKGKNKDKFITIKWQDDFETSSRFIYYGVGTRNEYRLTRFGKGFPFLTDDNVGDLLVLNKISDEYYEGFVLNNDDDIDSFFAQHNISSAETNALISTKFHQTAEEKLLRCFMNYLVGLNVDFPTTIELARTARNCYLSSHGSTKNQITSNPDRELLNWISAEYSLFKTIENDRYSEIINKPFSSVEDLIVTANSILNRRKSRAGRSLEHHLEEIFRLTELSFETQVTTEGNKKPDFLFPDVDSYQNPMFDDKKLVLLASKTTCKDRWRQILNEADRIKTKHLFTLQQGISKNQLNEMEKYGVQLVVPRAYLSSFPKEHRTKILTLNSFVEFVQGVQS